MPAEKSKKRQHPGKYARQYERTARNIKKRRERHHKVHPNDKQCISSWERSPILVRKP